MHLPCKANANTYIKYIYLLTYAADNKQIFILRFLFLCKAHKSSLVFLCKSTKLKKGIDKSKNVSYNKANNNEQRLTTRQE